MSYPNYPSPILQDILALGVPRIRNGSLVSGDRNFPIQTAASKYGGNYAKALLLLNQSGGPSANAANASALAWAGRIGGKAISGAFVDQSNTLQMLVNGMPVAV